MTFQDYVYNTYLGSTLETPTFFKVSPPELLPIQALLGPTEVLGTRKMTRSKLKSDPPAESKAAYCSPEKELMAFNKLSRK